MTDSIQAALRELTGEVKANTAITADLKAAFDNVEPRLRAVEDKTNAMTASWGTLKIIGGFAVGLAVIATPVAAYALS